MIEPAPSETAQPGVLPAPYPGTEADLLSADLAAQASAQPDEQRPPGILRRLPQSRVALVGIGLILFWVVLAVLAPWLGLPAPNANDFTALAHPSPGPNHLLGVDPLGRDVLSRIVWGARTVLTLAPVAVLVAYAFGCTIGVLAGYYGGLVDTLLSRLSDVILAFPVVVLYVILIANIGPSAFNIILAVTLTSAPAVGRIVRGLVLEVKVHDFVAAAQLRRESAWYIMLVELLPNCRGPLITDICLRLGYTTIMIGTLGFLGLGLPPPDPDWGGMVQQATAMITIYPHMALFPCLAIAWLVLGFNLLADGLSELSAAD